MDLGGRYKGRRHVAEPRGFYARKLNALRRCRNGGPAYKRLRLQTLQDVPPQVLVFDNGFEPSVHKDFVYDDPGLGNIWKIVENVLQKGR